MDIFRLVYIIKENKLNRENKREASQIRGKIHII